ncbi:MAG: hypothetical protein H0U22_07100 [Geodermatophilaceae bacterium]|nr:hypothetical protein [Geodermatophilaceae bacterium]
MPTAYALRAFEDKSVLDDLIAATGAEVVTTVLTGDDLKIPVAKEEELLAVLARQHRGGQGRRRQLCAGWIPGRLTGLRLRFSVVLAAQDSCGGEKVLKAVGVQFARRGDQLREQPVLLRGSVPARRGMPDDERPSSVVGFG